MGSENLLLCLTYRICNHYHFGNVIVGEASGRSIVMSDFQSSLALAPSNKVEDIHNPPTSREQRDNCRIGKFHTKTGKILFRTLHMHFIQDIVNRN